MKKKNIFPIILFYFLPLVFWMGLIFYFSSLSGNPESHYNLRIYLERKGAHIFEYFLLFLLAFRLFRCGLQRDKTNSYHWAFLLAWLFAFSDEIHQLFVPGREGVLQDVAFDIFGILFAFLFLRAVTFFRNRCRF